MSTIFSICCSICEFFSLDFFFFFLPGCLILVLTFFFFQNSTHFLPVCSCARLLLAPECLSELSLCQLQINKAISQLVRPYNQWRMPSPPPMHFVHRLFQGQSTLPARRRSHSRVFAASIVKKKQIKNAANKHSEASCQDPSCTTWATRFQARPARAGDRRLVHPGRCWMRTTGCWFLWKTTAVVG